METVEVSIKEKDWLIDDFMGRSRTNWGSGHKYRSYSNDWNMLMPVVEKIESLAIENKFVSVNIYENECRIWEVRTIVPEFNFFQIADKKIDAVWLCVIDFIQYYNSQTPTNE